MTLLRPAWNAFANMIHAARRDPVWAIASVVLAPFRSGRYLANNAVPMVIVVFVVIWVADWFMRDVAGLVRGDVLWHAGNIAVTGLILFILFRVISNPMIQHFGGAEGDTHGSARFATAGEIAPLTRSQTGLLIGRDPRSGMLLRYDGRSHLLTMAPTRTGKGVGTIIPNLLTANRSLICIDPKGENARITMRARTAFGPVHILDPFGATTHTTSAFNPFDTLDPDSPDIAEDAATLADTLVYDEPGQAGEAHWNEEAKALVSGIMLHIASCETKDRRTLLTVREALTLAPERFVAMLQTMQQSEAMGGLVARAANRHFGKSEREAAGVLSAAQRHTHFLDSPRMASVLQRSDFRFADLKNRTVTVFLVLPPDRLSAYARWLRLMVTQSLLEMTRSRATSSSPVLYLLDEFAALGRLDAIERAMGLMAGYGVQLWPILQDVHQLRATYGKRAGTFLSNAAVLQVFGVNDHDSARLVSDLIGHETVVFQTMARALDAQQSGLSFAEHHIGRPLLTPDEVRGLPGRRALLLLAGQRPILASKLSYHRDAEFAAMFDRHERGVQAAAVQCAELPEPAASRPSSNAGYGRSPGDQNPQTH